jgi:large subunit ribosomal protein L18
MNQKKRLVSRLKRKVRVRKKVTGSQERPRLSVFRSSRHCYAQVIDDVSGRTLASASTLAEAKHVDGSKIEAATVVGQALAESCLQSNIHSVVFDRNGYRYHGRIKAIAEAARSAGLKF